MKKNNKTKVLHIIPDVHYIGKTNYADMIDNLPEDERDNAGFWYLHGELENKIGFDKAVISNCKTLGINKPYKYGEELTINKLYLKGIYHCEVEGIKEPCVGYFWTTDEVNEHSWTQRGLVCLKSDKKACEYAENKMNEKAYVL